MANTQLRGSTEFKDLSITNNKLGPACVTDDKIFPQTITGASIAPGTIDNTLISPTAIIDTSKLADAAHFLFNNANHLIDDTIRYSYSQSQTFTGLYDLVTKEYVDNAVVVENLWDRAGTLLTTHFANDSVQIGGNLTVDNTTFNVDATTHKVGIGNGSPTEALDVTGNSVVSGDSTVVGNSFVDGNATIGVTASSTTFKVKSNGGNDGLIYDTTGFSRLRVQGVGTNLGTEVSICADGNNFLTFNSNDASTNYASIYAGNDTGGNLGITVNGHTWTLDTTGVLTNPSDVVLSDTKKVIFGNSSNAWVKYDGNIGGLAISSNGTQAYFGASDEVQLFANSNSDGSGTYVPALTLGGAGDARVLLQVDAVKPFMVTAAAVPTQVASAIVQIDSSTRGFLPPRMTTVQRDAIATPAAGLVIYNTDTNDHEKWDGTAWRSIGSVTNNEKIYFGIQNGGSPVWLRYNSVVDGLEFHNYNNPAGGGELTTPGPMYLYANTNGDQTGTWLPDIQLHENGTLHFEVEANKSVEIVNGFTAPTSIPSALLVLNSTIQGFLPPRMTTAQRDLIASPAIGLLIYNTDTSLYNFYSGTWTPVGSPVGAIGDVQFNAGGGLFGADNAFYWDNTNKRLGIGTNTPSVPLEVIGTANVSLLHSSTGFSGAMLFQPDSDATNAYRFLDSSASNTIVDIDTTNKRVGINTNTPTESLHVVGNVEVDGKLTVKASGRPVHLDSDTGSSIGFFNSNESKAIASLDAAISGTDVNVYLNASTVDYTSTSFHVQTQSGSGSNNYEWVFGSNGTLTNPGDVVLSDNNKVVFGNSSGAWLKYSPAHDTLVGSSAGSADLQLASVTQMVLYGNTKSDGSGNFYPYIRLFSDGGGLAPQLASVLIATSPDGTSGNEKGWTFDPNGKLTAPGTISIANSNGTVSGMAQLQFATPSSTTGFIECSPALGPGMMFAPNGDTQAFMQTPHGWELAANAHLDTLGPYFPAVDCGITGDMISFSITASGSNDVEIAPLGQGDAPSALLTLRSTTQGFMPPRMTTVQRDAIPTPDAGLIIYNTNTNDHEKWDGTSWKSIGSVSNNEKIYVGTSASLSFNSNFQVWHLDTPTDGNLADIESTGDMLLAADFPNTATPFIYLSSTTSPQSGGAGCIGLYPNNSTATSGVIISKSYYASPNASSILELVSTTQGFLPPRMTTTQRDAIATPAVGLVVFNTDTDRLNEYKSTGWSSVGDTKVTYETPTGATDGVNQVFTLAFTPILGTEEVYLNGLHEEGGGNDYTIVGNTITFVTAPPNGAKVRVTYNR